MDSEGVIVMGWGLIVEVHELEGRGQRSRLVDESHSCEAVP